MSSRIGSDFSLSISPIVLRAFSMPGGRALLRFASHIVDFLEDTLLYSKIITFSSDSAVIPSDRGKVIFDEATARGWRMETAVIFGRGVDTYRITLPSGNVRTFKGLPRVGEEDITAQHWIDDKALLKERLVAHDIPVSRGSSFTDVEKATEFMKNLGLPVIVKPRLGSRGRHTTTFLTEPDDFRDAFGIAQQLGRHVVVEEHLEGSVYRGTMIDGKLAGVLAGDPPRVTGDGVHTISELIEKKNANRHERVGAVVVTDMTHVFLKRRGYTLEDVLKDGVTIDLREKIGLSYGGNAREVTKETHPKLREELERAACVVNDPIIGFDFITPDVSADPDTVRWGIIECNALPFINLHHDPLEGEPVNVAGILLDYIYRNENLRK